MAAVAISTTELDNMEVPEQTDSTAVSSVVTGVKRPASEPSPDSAGESEGKKKKSSTTYNWGALYFKTEGNVYTIDHNEGTKQYDFLSPNGRKFVFTTPATKALCKYLRKGGNLGKFQFSKTEDQASINTMLILGTNEKLKGIHNEFRQYLERLEDSLLEAMWENEDIKSAMMRSAKDIMGDASDEKLQEVAHKLFLEGAQRIVKPGEAEGEFSINAKTRAFYETIKNSGEWRAQELTYFDAQYEQRDSDFELGTVAMIGVVLKPTGFTTPGFAKYGLSLRLGHEVVVYKELGANAVTVDRKTLFDTTRPYTFSAKTNKAGQRKVYVKNSNGSDFTWITDGASVKYNVESNCGKFEGKIKKENSKYEGTLVLSDENLEFVRKVYNDACNHLIQDEHILKDVKEKLRKTASVIEKPFEEVFRSKFQGPIRDDGTVKVSSKEYYEGAPGDWERQPFPIENATGEVTDDDKILSGSKIEMPLRFSIYTLSSGIFGMKLDINTRYHTRIVEEAGFVEGAPPPPTFDF